MKDPHKAVPPSGEPKIRWRRVSRFIPRLPAILFLFLAGLLSGPADGAHGRRARTVVRPRPESSENRYDRSITTFSDDGRLLQVEYGIAASNRGETVACLDLDGIIEGGGVCVAAVVAGAASGATGEGEGEGIGEEDALVPAFREERDKVYRVDDHALLIPTGLSGDGRALASSVRLACRRMRLMCGEAPTLLEIARVAAGIQHELTRTGGARPFGVTATVVGVDPLPHEEEEFKREEDKGNGDDAVSGSEGLLPEAFGMTSSAPAGGSEFVMGQPQLYQSEPGGVLERCDFCSAGRGRDRAVSRLAEVRRDGLERRRRGKAVSDPDSSILSSPSPSPSRTPLESEALLVEVITGVAKAALESYDDKPFSEANGESSQSRRYVDIWLIRSGPGRRGGARIRVARFVTGGSELEEVAQRLALT